MPPGMSSGAPAYTPAGMSPGALAAAALNPGGVRSTWRPPGMSSGAPAVMPPGMSVAELRKIDAGLELDPVVPMMQTTTSYCIAGTVGTKTWKNSNADHVSAVAGACLPRPRSRASPVAGRRSA